MRMLSHVDEFKSEASKALFTKHQAMTITLKLLQEEISDFNSTKQDIEILREAMRRVHVSYLDAATTKTDLMLDSLGVARLTAEDIALAIETMLYEIQIQINSGQN